MQNEKDDTAKLILRCSIAFVFFYFATQQITSPDSWASLIPEFAKGGFLSANNLVILNGVFELTFGLLLISGLYLRFASFILSIHLIIISITMGFTPTGIRDFGLAFATFTLFLLGPDKYCLDNKLKKN